MVEEITGLSGSVSAQAPVGGIADGEIISMAKGRAVEFMTPQQCADRKTPEDTPFIMVEIGIAEYGTITKKTFRDYSGADGKNIISPNTFHGQLINTYELLNKGDIINMIASKKATSDGAMIVWKIVIS